MYHDFECRSLGRIWPTARHAGTAALALGALLLLGVTQARSQEANAAKPPEFSVLYTFTGGNDGNTPVGLVLDREGNLYGSATYGGNLTVNAGYGWGVVFKLAKGAAMVQSYDFSGPNGSFPNRGLVRDEQGNLYGTTYGGGAYDDGTVFQHGQQ